ERAARASDGDEQARVHRAREAAGGSAPVLGPEGGQRRTRAVGEGGVEKSPHVRAQVEEAVLTTEEGQMSRRARHDVSIRGRVALAARHAAERRRIAPHAVELLTHASIWEGQ